MNLTEGIKTRSSIGKLSPEPLDRETISSLIEAAIQAPNHHLTEPWRFFVLTGDALDELGEVMENALVEQKPDASPDERARERAKPLRAPVIIAVTAEAGSDAVETIENFAATAAAVENLLLAAHDVGLGAHWRTGPTAYAPAAKKWLGISETSAIVAFVYLGHPAMNPKPRHRTDPSVKTVWMGSG
ncbi:MAG TPA: nitroreductase [Armatimonadota bacterium]|nr:nitroreductase [Armatimonadota bacterium]